MNTRAEINEIETRRTIERSTKLGVSFFLKKTYRIDKREGSNKKRINVTEMQRIIRHCYN
jgi:hypothetical protein